MCSRYGQRFFIVCHGHASHIDHTIMYSCKSIDIRDYFKNSLISPYYSPHHTHPFSHIQAEATASWSKDEYLLAWKIKQYNLYKDKTYHFVYIQPCWCDAKNDVMFCHPDRSYYRLFLDYLVLTDEGARSGWSIHTKGSSTECVLVGMFSLDCGWNPIESVGTGIRYHLGGVILL